MKLRGPDPATKGQSTLYPATTNRDITELATLWTREVARASIDNDTDKVRAKQWRDCIAQVHRDADVAAHPDAVYAHTYDFWRCMEKIAIWLDVRKLRPSTWDLVVDSVGEAVEDLPNTFGDAAHAVGGAGKRAVGAAGDAASAVGRGLVDFFDKPVTIIAVLIGGALVIPPVVRALRGAE